MENASKALLIAGAVLIAILLIAVGMMMYNGSLSIFKQGTSTMSQQEKQAFNSKFEIYEGNISGSNLKALIKVVNLNNADEENSEVTISGEGISSDDNGYSFSGKTTTMYKISFTDDNGIITTITSE